MAPDRVVQNTLAPKRASASMWRNTRAASPSTDAKSKLHYAVLSTPRKGNCRLNLERLTLRAMLLWLQHQAEEELGRRDEVSSERPMPQPIGA